MLVRRSIAFASGHGGLIPPPASMSLYGTRYSAAPGVRRHKDAAELQAAHLAAEGQVLLPGAGVPEVAEVVLEPDLKVERGHAVAGRLQNMLTPSSAKGPGRRLSGMRVRLHCARSQRMRQRCELWGHLSKAKRDAAVDATAEQDRHTQWGTVLLTPARVQPGCVRSGGEPALQCRWHAAT